ncbi:hypothetical protein G5I_03561 [Acromyrmex echinatior]|uniref:Uncharacterized protein n=1 Tax=Acromyrmex echinatior TaxID=103372 RepID=F4WDA8_ACREC|nr:hypothetical protein G5I_03561 [Acromyrmex echinatior]
MPYVRYSRVPIAMWYPLMRVHVLPSVCEGLGKTRPTCQYDESIRVYNLELTKLHGLMTAFKLTEVASLFTELLNVIGWIYKDTLHSGQKNKKFSKIKENMQTNHRAETAVLKVLRRARLIGTGTTSVKASGALKRKRGQIRFWEGERDRGACIIWSFLGTANE